MAMYPNSRHMSFVAGRHFGPGPGLENKFRDRSDRFNIYTCETFNKSISFPAGYGIQTPVPCYSPGGISSQFRAYISIAASGEGALGLIAAGDAAIDISASADLTGSAWVDGSIAVNLSASGDTFASTYAEGSASISLLAQASVSGSLFSSGNATLTIGADGTVDMTVAVEGSAVISLDAIGTVAAVTYITGHAGITLDATGEVYLTVPAYGVATLSLNAAGTLGAIAWTSGNAPTTLSGSGSLDAKGWISGTTEDPGITTAKVADAVWQKVIEAGFTAEQVLRILAAQAAGTATGLNSSSAQFYGLDGSTVRIAGEITQDGRNVTALDGD